MRTFPVELGELQLDLAVTFGVAADLAKNIGDPMAMARDGAAAIAAERIGIAYQAKFAWGVDNIPKAIWLGAKPNHPDLKLSAVQEACVDVGFMNAMQIADAFVAQFLVVSGKEKVETKDDPAPGE